MRGTFTLLVTACTLVACGPGRGSARSRVAPAPTPLVSAAPRPEPPAPPAPAQATPDHAWLTAGVVDEERERRSRSLVPYDCGWLPFRACGAESPSDALAELRAILERDDGAPLDLRALGPRLVGLGFVAKVLAQDAVRRFADAAEAPSPIVRPGSVAQRLRDAAHLLALLRIPRDELAHEGSAPRLRELLGPTEGWTERRAYRRPLLHEAHAEHRVLFRAVRAGSIRALFAQATAVDEAWQVHLTPVVTELALRRGRAHAAPACVAAAEESCGALRPRSQSGPFTDFFRVTEEGEAHCESCHAGPTNVNNLVDVPAAAAPQELAERREALFARARPRIERLKRLAPRE